MLGLTVSAVTTLRFNLQRLRYTLYVRVSGPSEFMTAGYQARLRLVKSLYNNFHFSLAYLNASHEQSKFETLKRLSNLIP